MSKEILVTLEIKFRYLDSEFTGKNIAERIENAKYQAREDYEKILQGTTIDVLTDIPEYKAKVIQV